MAGRTVVPFDTWSMQVDVPVSQLVRHGDLAWSCGQCPLDAQGQVLFSGDLVAQTASVCDYIDQITQRGGMDRSAIAKLVVYHVADRPGAADAMVAVLRQRFGAVPLLVPVAVPHFYYDGMMIEVDVFFGPDIRRLATAGDAEAGVNVEAVEGGGLVWAQCHVPGSGSGPLSGARSTRALQSLLGGYGLSASNLLSDHWFLSADDEPDEAPGQQLSGLEDSGLITDCNAAVITSAARSSAGVLAGDLTFVAGMQCTLDVISSGTASVAAYCRRSGTFLWVSASCGDPSLGLVGQTAAMMRDIEAALVGQGMAFSNVAKLTAHYVGGATPEELHGNMTVRHGYYASPGPASTGLPVARLHGTGARISIDVMALA